MRARRHAGGRGEGEREGEGVWWQSRGPGLAGGDGAGGLLRVEAGANEAGELRGDRVLGEGEVWGALGTPAGLCRGVMRSNWAVLQSAEWCY